MPGELNLLIKQKKEWGEILTGFETRNRYAITGEDGEEKYLAAEESGFLGRWFLGSLRPFTIHVLSPDGQSIFDIQRYFRFYFHKVDVRSAAGDTLGSIVRKFTLLRRHYEVLDAQGAVLFELFGPILKPWTFFIRRGEKEIGKITKKWSGLLKEAFTDADTFGLNVDADTKPEHVVLLLGAVFLIDFVHFESKSR